MLYIKNAHYIDPHTFELSATCLAVEAGGFGACHKIPRIPDLARRAPEDRVLDARNRFVSRAFACGHHHVYSTLSRGMPVGQTPHNFQEVLKYVWWRMDKLLDHDMIEASALFTALQCAKNGVTFVIDHHASPFHLEGSLEIIARAFDRLGLGHLLCYEISCRDGQAIAEKGLAETGAYLRSGRKGHVGLHASFTVDDSTLQQAVALALTHHTGVHIHVAEGTLDQEHCLTHYKKRVIHRLHDAGVLDLPFSILGHCIHVNAAERTLIEAAPCWVVQNTESNQNNTVGLGTYASFPHVMLGTDGMHSDMLRSAQATYFAAQAIEPLSPAAAYTRLRAVHTLTRAMQAPGDSENNLLIFNYDSPTPLTASNFLGHFFYGLNSRHIDTVISQGRVLVENGQLVSGEENDICAYAQEQAIRLWQALEYVPAENTLLRAKQTPATSK